jgi:hypothetical protein
MKAVYGILLRSILINGASRGVKTFLSLAFTINKYVHSAQHKNLRQALAIFMSAVTLSRTRSHTTLEEEKEKEKHNSSEKEIYIKITSNILVCHGSMLSAEQWEKRQD